MSASRRFVIALFLALASTGLVFAQENDIPVKLRKLADELGCSTKVECRKIFDANFERGIQLAEQYRVYNSEQQKLAKTFKESVLQKLSSVPAEELERAIVDVARGILEKNSTLAKQLRINEEHIRAAEDIDDMKRLARDLAAGKYPGLGNNPDEAGVICLRPDSPTACDEIAAQYFGPEGVAELARARSGVQDVVDDYRGNIEDLELQLPDGRVLAGRDEIRRRCDQAFQGRDIATAERCGRFAVAHGFVSEDEVRRGLEFLRNVEGRGVDFRRCDRDPAGCEQYLPEAQRSEFAAMRQLEDIMRKYIGFDPRECSRGDSNPDIGQRCFEGSKKAIAEIDSLNLATQSAEVARIVAEIKGHIRRGEEYDHAREEAQREVQQRGGPGNCKTEAECATYCGLPEHGPECIAFGAKVGVFRPGETNDRLQRYEDRYQRAIRQPITNPATPNIAPVGPSPECFRAIKEGDFVKAKEICRVSSPPDNVRLLCPTIAVRPETCADQPGTIPDMDEQCRVVCRPSPQVPPVPPGPPQRDICPSLPTVEACPSGQVRRVTYSSPQCGVYYGCFPDPFAKQCPEGQYWVEASEGAGYCKQNAPRCDTATCEPRTRCSTPVDPEYNSQECRALRNDLGTLPPPIGDSCAAYGYGWHRMESETGHCYGPEMREFRVRSGVRYECGKQPADILAPGCAPRPSPTQCLQGQYWNGVTCVATGTSASSCDINLKNLLGDGCHYMYNDVSGNQVFCNSPMTMSAKRGDTATTPGCQPPSGGGGGGGTPPAGQREQIWNALGLRSWVRADVDAVRIDLLKQSCGAVSPGANIWMPGAGDPTSVDFGLPDPAKCSLAVACTTSQYFDGTRCTTIGGGGGGGVVPPACPSGQSWNGTACVSGGGGGGTPPAGQREQIWNILLLRSYVRTDADSARIEQLKQACANTKPTHNVWLSGSGDPASTDFGMPDPAKCQAANACASGEYFDGSRCTTGGGWTTSCPADVAALLGAGCHPMGGGAYFNGEMTRWIIPPATVVTECSTSHIAGCTTGTSGNQGQTCPAGQAWNGTACVPISNTPPPSSCPADVAPLLGTGCHTMGNAWFDGGMTRYVFPNTTIVKECTINYLAGCTVGSPQTRTYRVTPLANVFHVLLQLLR